MTKRKRILIFSTVIMVSFISVAVIGMHFLNSQLSASVLDDTIQISYENNRENFVSNKTNSGVQNYITCFESAIKEEDFTDEMKKKLDEIYSLFKDNKYRLSFAYEDLYTGLHISYNEKQTYFSASTIKSPVALYLYEQAEKGKIHLDSKMKYTANFYVEGSGSLQYKPFGDDYSLRDLTKRTIVESDNVTYQMIASAVNQEEIRNFWKEKGAENFWSESVWGSNNARDSIIYMKELYDYSTKNTELSNELMSYHYNSVKKLIKSKNNAKVAHKSGWHYEIMHDTAIVFDEHPYALAIMTDKGEADFVQFFTKASNLIAEFHELYWQSKTNYCYNQSFK